MAQSSSAKRQVPAGFPDRLSVFAREILREYSLSISAAGGHELREDSHLWVYKFAAGFFEKGGVAAAYSGKLKSEARPGDPAPRPGHVAGKSTAKDASASAGSSEQVSFPSPMELQRKIQTIFQSADHDGSGVWSAISRPLNTVRVWNAAPTAITRNPGPPRVPPGLEAICRRLELAARRRPPGEWRWQRSRTGDGLASYAGAVPPRAAHERRR